MKVEVRRLSGEALGAAIPEIAALRIKVFRDWPYLYDGTLAYEETYLAPYVTSQRAVVVGAFDGTRLVGASTATPLTDHANEFGAAFAHCELVLGQVFYCAESVLLPEFRGQGVGHRFFDLREAAGRDFGYRHSAFCAVVRSDTHPLKPASYRPLDAFWKARGYAPMPGVTATFRWKDVDMASETDKVLQFWSRAL